VPLADVYLEFLGGRCRPNTVRAAAYDLKVFFTVVARPPDQVRPADVLAFITASTAATRSRICSYSSSTISAGSIIAGSLSLAAPAGQ
jgi:hypothetical protein